MSVIVLAYSPTFRLSHDRLWRALEQLPPFSPVLQKLLSALTKEQVSFKFVATLVEKDAVLAGHVLRLVNSAAGGFRSRVNSVTHAISLLGVMKLRNVLLGLSISQMWSQLRCGPSWSHARFNLHNVAVATFADLVVQEFPAVYPEGAFIAGLLHDLGRLLIAMAWRDEFEAELRRQTTSPSPSMDWLAWEQDLLGATHAEISAIALARWRLPEPIQEAVRDHHVVLAEPLLTTSSSTAPWPLAQVIAVADAEAHSYGLGYLPIPETADLKQRGSQDAEQRPECWTRLRDQFHLEIQPLQAFYLTLDHSNGKERAQR